MEEVFELSDRISVLRDGQMIGCLTRDEATRDRIISMMVGRALPAATREAAPKGAMWRCRPRRSPARGVFENISLMCGTARSWALRAWWGGPQRGDGALVGYDPLDSGELSVGGRPVAIRHPRDAKRHRIALASEDRKALGADFVPSIRENVSIQNEDQYSRSGFMNHRRERELVDGITRQVTVKMNGIQDLGARCPAGTSKRWCWPKCLLSKPRC
jgi:ABC-type sugar transport system ATPase subunit